MLKTRTHFILPWLKETAFFICWYDLELIAFLKNYCYLSYILRILEAIRFENNVNV